MMTDDIRTLVYPLPGNIRSFVVQANGYFTIMINDSLSPEARYKAYMHERDHISRGDFESPLKADFIEVRAHKS